MLGYVYTYIILFSDMGRMTIITCRVTELDHARYSYVKLVLLTQ